MRYQDLLNENGAVQNFEARMRRRDGSVFTVLYSGSLVTLGGQTYSLSSLQDISDRKRAEEWQQHYADTLAQITAEAPLAQVLDSLALFAEKQSPGMLLLDPRWSRRTASGCCTRAAPACRRTSIAPSTACRSARTRQLRQRRGQPAQIVIVEDMHGASRLGSPGASMAEAAGVRACWSHPVPSADGRILGTFALYRREPSDRPRRRTWSWSGSRQDWRRSRSSVRSTTRTSAWPRWCSSRASQGLMVTDIAGRVLMVNASFESLTGYVAARGGRASDRPSSTAGRDEPSALRARREALASERALERRSLLAAQARRGVSRWRCRWRR